MTASTQRAGRRGLGALAAGHVDRQAHDDLVGRGRQHAPKRGHVRRDRVAARDRREGASPTAVVGDGHPDPAIAKVEADDERHEAVGAALGDAVGLGDGVGRRVG